MKILRTASLGSDFTGSDFTNKNNVIRTDCLIYLESDVVHCNMAFAITQNWSKISIKIGEELTT